MIPYLLVSTEADFLDDVITANPLLLSHENILNQLINELDWVRIDKTPRSEYYCNDYGVPYTYGSGRGVRTYTPNIWHPTIDIIRKAVEQIDGTKFDMAFLNLYRDGSDQLGWHADDSDEIDDSKPIAIVSIGPIQLPNSKKKPFREIWFAKNGTKDNIVQLPLYSGSLCIMSPGMQDTHIHRIPKSSCECGPRISITLRGYVTPNI